jgi:4'-phosphopantetheinyl transferase
MDLPLQEIHLWCARPEELLDEAARHAAVGLLSADELRRLRRFRVEKPRRRFLAGRAMLRRVLSGYDTRPPAAWAFEIARHGRPAIAGGNPLNLQFNLSKSSDLVVCAVTREVIIGVDVENVRRRAPLDVAETFFAPAEVAALRALPLEQQPGRFFEYWTLKESYIKARGLGLTIPLDQFAFRIQAGRSPRIEIDPRQQDDPAAWQFVHVRPTEEHLVALCVRRERPLDTDADVQVLWHPLAVDHLTY